MKKVFALLLALSLLFGFSSCEKDSPKETVADAAECVITWSSEAEAKPSEMLTDLTQDAMLALLKDSFKETVHFTNIAFSVKGTDVSSGLHTMAFDADVTYRELIAGENPAEPLTLDEEVLLELPMRVTAEEAEGKIVPESLFLETLEEVNGHKSGRSATLYLPEFGDAGMDTITGELKEIYEENGDLRIVIDRFLWVPETNGYTDNGYFVMDLHHQWTVYRGEDCMIDFYEDVSSVTGMSLEKFVEEGLSFENRIFDFTEEFGSVKYIIERYRP